MISRLPLASFPHRVTALLAALSIGFSASGSAQDDTRETIVVDGKMWSLVTSAEPLPWTEANAFCETLDLEGHSDWRLPSLLELEALHDPSAESGLPAPIELDDCCAWSSSNLLEIPAEQKGNLPEPGQGPQQYYWGYLFASGVRYYSSRGFPDGLALCVREAGGG
jgi:hypothetical protein